MIEVYPESVTLRPGDGEKPVQHGHEDRPDYEPFHLLLSVPVDRDTVQRIGTREGYAGQCETMSGAFHEMAKVRLSSWSKSWSSVDKVKP